MKINRGYTYRLKPTGLQEQQFRQFAGVCRLVYNLGLEQRRDHWRQFKRGTGKNLSFPSQCRELTALRREFGFISACPQEPQQQALRDLDRSFVNFYRGTAEYPTHRRKGVNDSFRFKKDQRSANSLRIVRSSSRWGRVNIPKVGWVKFRNTRAIPDGVKINNITVTLTIFGWFMSVNWEIEAKANEASHPARAVGVDRGVKVPLMLSNGTNYQMPDRIFDLEKQQKRAQRSASRRKRGSNRHRKAMRRAALLKARQARIRKHWAHGVTTEIARSYGAVVIEDLKTRNMTKSAKGTIESPGRNVAAKRGLNRAILSVGWHQIETMLSYKLAERGGKLIKVNPSHTSQLCSKCGLLDRKSRKNQATFICTGCGYRENADLNAAVNILRRGNTSVLDVEGSCIAHPVEASTHREAT